MLRIADNFLASGWQGYNQLLDFRVVGGLGGCIDGTMQHDRPARLRPLSEPIKINAALS